MTQYDKIRVGKGADKKYLHYKDIVPLADLNDIVFGTWDVYPQNAYQAAMYAEVLKEKDINPVREELEKVVPMTLRMLLYQCINTFLSFGVVFQPRTFSAQDLSTSELLRTL